MKTDNDHDRKKRIRQDLNKEAQKKHRRNLTEDQSKEIKSINTSQRKEARVHLTKKNIVLLKVLILNIIPAFCYNYKAIINYRPH